MKSLRLQLTVLALLVAFAFGPGATPASAQVPYVIYCINATSTPCIVASQVGNGFQGDDGWLFSGKINADFAALPPQLFVGAALPVNDGGTGALTLTGPLKGNGTAAISAALATDIVNLFSACSGTQYLGADGACHSASGSGTVTSIAATVPSFLSVAGSPITTSGTLAISLSGTALPAANGGTGATSLAGANIPVQSGAITSGHCAQWATATSITDAGATCGAGGTTTIASGTSALGTSAIGSGACATVVTTSASGVATTDAITWSFNADPTSTTGYTPTISGMLTIISYPTANNVNWKICNTTASSITPGAVTLNWRVVR